MLVSIAAIGRMKAGPERELVSRYLERAAASGRNLGLAGFSVVESAESRAADVTRRRQQEGAALTAHIAQSAAMVALDERGQGLSSEELAQRIAAWRDAGRTATVFLIGGPDGLDPALRARAELILSFSALTWPHQLARIMLAEQLYRITTILAGHPYHRGG